MSQRNFKIRALGEIAIRCRDLGAMRDFYQNILGLEPLTGNQSDGIVFFRIADGFAGHTSVLALFEQTENLPPAQNIPAEPPYGGPQSSLHHIALSLPFAEQQAVMDWYSANSLEFSIQHFGWIGWRGIFTRDPEGNTVELVSFDESQLSKNNPDS